MAHDTPEFNADLFVYSLILGSIANSIPVDARQRIQNGEIESVLNETVGGAMMKFADIRAGLENG